MSGELEELGERIAEHAAHLDAATHRLLADLRDFDRRGGWHAQGALSCAHWLAWRVGWDLVTARERVRAAGKLADFPLIDDALRRGELSYSKVRALLRIASPTNEAMLLEHARLMTASQLEKLSCKYALVQRHDQEHRPRDDAQRRYVRRRDTEDGMVKIEAVLHPEEAEIIWTMLDHAAKHLGRALHPEAEASASHASAESRGTTHTGHAACAMAASAEARGGTATHASTTTIMLSDLPTHQSDASAESRGLPDTHAAMTATMLSDITAHLGADSGASQAAPNAGVVAAPAQAVAAFAMAGSAESRGLTDTHAGMTAIMLSDITAGLGDDSAASREAPRAGVVAAPAQAVAAFAMAGSAESRTAPGRSLLDRLLDEAEAARGPSLGTAVGPGDIPRATTNPAREPSVLHHQVDATKRAFNRADALLSVAQAYLRGDRPHRVPVEVTITIPASSLRRETVDVADAVDAGWMGDSCVSTEAARRLSCDAGVIEVIEDEHGVPLSVGRKRRTIAGSIKRALLKRDTACSFPGCTHQTFLEGHHIKHWADGGETSLDNTSLLCTHHHRYVHEYGYTIEVGPDKHPRFRDPGGRLVAAVPARDIGPELGWPQIRAANEVLAIDAETIACEWDGRPVEYARVIDELVVVDGLT